MGFTQRKHKEAWQNWWKHCWYYYPSLPAELIPPIFFCPLEAKMFRAWCVVIIPVLSTKPNFVIKMSVYRCTSLFYSFLIPMPRYLLRKDLNYISPASFVISQMLETLVFCSWRRHSKFFWGNFMLHRNGDFISAQYNQRVTFFVLRWTFIIIIKQFLLSWALKVWFVEGLFRSSVQRGSSSVLFIGCSSQCDKLPCSSPCPKFCSMSYPFPF